MGFMDTLKKGATTIGEVNSSSFPFGIVNTGKDDNGEKCLIFTYGANNTEEKITHKMIKCATILAMGVIKVDNGRPVEGVKYLCVLNDGRQGVITINATAGTAQSFVESILF